MTLTISFQRGPEAYFFQHVTWILG